ncbi:hypothetical protein [Bacillus cereus]|uniref:hypothetical protein n=1 Tax=Bacillus cereus TaxID=1396 RepID=UPI000BF650F4|nr:hypothetical protein [Bacillus cereus]PFI17432.1 hypothetical protein COI75_19690 [Bacillus cereus]
MKKVYFTLFAEHIEFDTPEQKTEREKLKEYIFISESLTSQSIDDLFIELMQIKTDWMDYKLTEDKDNMYVKITLLFPYTEGKKVTHISSEIFSLIENFINANKSTAQHENRDTAEDSDEDTEGLLIKINSREGIDPNEFLLELKKQNIDFDIITKNITRVEAGAGNTIVEFILHMKDTAFDGIVSGAAWDIMKTGIFTLLVRRTDSSRSTSKNIKYKKLRKSISIRTNIKPKDLTLIDSYENDSETICEFKGNNLNITVICDENYDILEFSVENLLEEIGR